MVFLSTVNRVTVTSQSEAATAQQLATGGVEKLVPAVAASASFASVTHAGSLASPSVSEGRTSEVGCKPTEAG